MMLVKRDIFGIMHYVRDLEVASRWYCDNLGFSIGSYDFNDFVELTLDGQYVMHLFKSLDSSPAERAYFVLGTDDIENTYHTLSSRNVSLHPIRHFGDHAGFTLKDYDGNVLMICQYFN